MAELTFGEEDCIAKKELRSLFVEEFAVKQGHTIFSYDMFCVETDMFKYVPKKSTWQSHIITLYPILLIPKTKGRKVELRSFLIWQSHKFLLYPNLEPSGFVSEP